MICKISGFCRMLVFIKHAFTTRKNQNCIHFCIENKTRSHLLPTFHVCMQQLFNYVISLKLWAPLRKKYLFKINKRNTKASYETCSLVTITASEQRQWRRSDVFLIYFNHILYLCYLCSFSISSASILGFEQATNNH